MKNALIDPNSQVQALTGWTPNIDPTNPAKYLPVFTPIPNSARVAQVVAQGGEFPVCPPLFWTPCDDNIVADQWYYDTQTTQFVVVPPPAPYPGEISTGLQTV